MIKAALILAVAFVIGGFLAGGRYTANSGDRFGVFVTDRFTGASWLCVQSLGCRKLENSD
jgi:hypothetical protein